MKTRYYFSVVTIVDGRETDNLMVTSECHCDINDSFTRFFNALRDKGGRLLEFKNDSFLVVFDKYAKRLKKGSYQYDIHDPYVNAITI